jgi:hypothetical protein
MILLKYFETMEYNDKHGAIVVSDLIVTPFYWILAFGDFNEILCKLAYLPLFVIFVMVFTVCNLVLTPIFMVRNFVEKVYLALDEDSAIHALQKFFKAMEYLLISPVFMIMAIVIDPLRFSASLFLNYRKHHTQEISVEAFNLFEKTCLQLKGKVGVTTFNK